jgi:hypothetical protein
VRLNGIEMLATVLAAFINEEWYGGEMPMTKQLIAEIRSGFWLSRDWRRKQRSSIYLLKSNKNKYFL